MNVVTISRQLGSLGSAVGKLVAEKMGYRLVWRDLINQAASRAGAPELALAMIDDLGLLGLSPSAKQRQAYLEAVSQVLIELANSGNVVIIGRAGQVVLHGHPEALHVRIIAPEVDRIARIRADKNVTAEAARAQIIASDRTRKIYLSRFYQVNWEDPGLYDLTINTAHMDCEAAASLVCHALTLPISVVG